MKIGVIIPTRGDRNGFLENALRMLKAQIALTVSQKNIYSHVQMRWEDVIVVDFTPENGKKDITKRYRIGYDKLRGRGLDAIFFWEDDDWYSPMYISVMISEWIKAGRPDLFGTAYTIYYHLKLEKYFKFEHYDRASAMNTLIVPDLVVPWPADDEPYTDAHLWLHMRGKTFTPAQHIAIGMKHGIGLTGGGSHVDRLHRYKHGDSGLLLANLDRESLKFYNDVTRRLNQ